MSPGALERASTGALDGDLGRSGLSRWVADVFDDCALAGELLGQEQRCPAGPDTDSGPRSRAASGRSM